MKWDVTLLLSVPTSINRISCFRCTFVLIPIGGRSWLYKLLCKNSFESLVLLFVCCVSSLLFVSSFFAYASIAFSSISSLPTLDFISKMSTSYVHPMYILCTSYITNSIRRTRNAFIPFNIFWITYCIVYKSINFPIWIFAKLLQLFVNCFTSFGYVEARS